MNRILHWARGIGIWVLIAWAATIAVGVWAYQTNHNTQDRQDEVIRANRQQIEYLCETVKVIDRLTVQQTNVWRVQLQDDRLRPIDRQRIENEIEIFEEAHFELSDQRACQDF